MINVNSGPHQQIHVGACGDVGWAVVFEAGDYCADVSKIVSARLWVQRPVGCTPEIVTWPLTIETGTATRREAYYAFRGVDVAQDPPDLQLHGKYLGIAQYDLGGGKWIRFGDTMVLTVTPNP